MFVKNEIEEIEGVARELECNPLLRAAFASGGLTLSHVRVLLREEEAERGFAEPSSAGAHGGRGRPAPARRAVPRSRTRTRTRCRG
jgi:hypothetical protein